jgi:maltose phosphorylase
VSKKRYFDIDPWRVVETGFDPAYEAAAEAVFSLGNGNMEVSGYFDESCPGFEGIDNTVDWVRTEITAGGETLDLAASRFSGFSRTLDMRTGQLERTFVWHTEKGADVELTFFRVLSMVHGELGASRIRWKVVRGETDVSVRPGLRFARDELWDVLEEDVPDENFLALTGTNKETGQTLYAAVYFNKSKEGELTRAVHLCKRDKADYEALSYRSYDRLLEENREWWETQWEKSGIPAAGDPEELQAARYGLFKTASHIDPIGEYGL